jgi:ribosome-binding factor A
MESKRNKQLNEMVKRHFSLFLQEEGRYIYSNRVLVSVTEVKMTSDFMMARVYLSVFNTENKQEPILALRENYQRVRQVMGNRLKSHMRRIPEFSFFIDETLDEMYKVDALFERLYADEQMGKEEEESTDESAS